MHKTILILWSLFIPLFIFGQQYDIRGYSVKDGLVQSRVHTMLQDSRGFIWLGTEGGVSQFDGHTFTNYTTSDGLLNNTVNVIYEDHEHAMWFGTMGGLSRFDGKRFINFTTENSELQHLQVNVVEQGPDSNLWVGTEAGIGIFRYDPKKRELVLIKQMSKNEGVSRVNDILFDREGNIWISKFGQGITCFLKNKSSFFSTVYLNNQYSCKVSIVGQPYQCVNITKEKDGLGNNFVRSIFQANNGFIWTANWRGGVNKIKPAQPSDQQLNIEYYTTSDGLPTDRIWTVHQDDHNNIWFGTDGFGLCRVPFDTVEDEYKVSPKRIDLIQPENGISGTHITTMLLDQEGNMWWGTWNNGIMKYKGPAFTYFNKQHGLSNNNVLSVFEDNAGNMWFGTWGGGASRFNGQNFKIYSWNKGLSESIVTSIIEAGGDLWIGTIGGGLNKWALDRDYPSKKFKTYNTTKGLSSNFVFSLCYDSRGYIWVGTEGGGVCVFDPQKGLSATLKNYNRSDGLAGNTVHSILEDTEGNIWLATDEGISCIPATHVESPAHHFSNFTNESGLPNAQPITLLDDKRGNIWIGLNSGGISIARNSVYMYEETPNLHWDYITTQDGLNSGSIFTLIMDENNNVWAGTNKGVNKIILDEHVEVEHIEEYGKLEGFKGIECNKNAGYRDEQGNLWFGTINGAIKYNPAAKTKNRISPHVHITDLKLFFKKIDWDMQLTGNGSLEASFDSLTQWFGLPYHIRLPYNNNHLTFEYVGVQTTIPQKTKYKFKLEGFDKTWSPVTKKTSATYANLPPGKYTFKVKAANSDGVWNVTPATYSFTITPPFWRTVWFYVFSGLALLGGIGGVVVLRERNLKRSKQFLSLKVDQRTREVRKQKEELEQQNEVIQDVVRDLTDSIAYARKIQDAILTRKEAIKDAFPRSFIFYQPRDIVSGDFYWFTQQDKQAFIAAVDCTGHGVPGAFMSMIGNLLLNEIVNYSNIRKPSKILEQLREGVIHALNQREQESTVKDGMDIALCRFDFEKKQLQYAGAYNPLYRVRNGKLKEIEADPFPIGTIMADKLKPFTNHKLSFKKGDTFYIFSDGFIAQFGGNSGKKYNSPRFRQLLEEIAHLPIDQQSDKLYEEYNSWKGDEDQVDDILVIGIKC